MNEWMNKWVSEWMNAMECNGMQWNAMECNGRQWNAMECNGMQWNAMECNGMQWNAMECNGMQWNAVECNGIECIQRNGMEWNGLESLNEMTWHEMKWNGTKWNKIKWKEGRKEGRETYAKNAQKQVLRLPSQNQSSHSCSLFVASCYLNFDHPCRGTDWKGGPFFGPVLSYVQSTFRLRPFQGFQGSSRTPKWMDPI